METIGRDLSIEEKYLAQHLITSAHGPLEELGADNCIGSTRGTKV
jgi:hypothetical protein